MTIMTDALAAAEARLVAAWPDLAREGRRLAARFGRVDSAEDLTQEGGLRAWRVLCSDPAASTAYLLTAARHEMHHYLEEDLLVRVPRSTRRLARHARRLVDDAGLSEEEAAASVGLSVWTLRDVLAAEAVEAEDPATWDDDDRGQARPAVLAGGDAAGADQAGRVRVRRVLASLPLESGDVLALAFGLRDGVVRSTAELAAVLGVSKSTAARRLARARRAFAEAWTAAPQEVEHRQDVDVLAEAMAEARAYVAALVAAETHADALTLIQAEGPITSATRAPGVRGACR